jgi:hypothetical protein
MLVAPNGMLVAPNGNKWRLVAVRSHFGLRLEGRINPERAFTTLANSAKTNRFEN